MILMTTLTPAKKPESKLETTNLLRTSFLRHFGILNDPRIDRTKEHLLIDIVAIAVYFVKEPPGKFAPPLKWKKTLKIILKNRLLQKLYPR
jgi:hypothetical protein